MQRGFRDGGLLVGAAALLVVGCATPEPANLCPAELRYQVAEEAEPPERVEAVGDWNDWTTGRTILAQESPGVFVARLRLPPGDFSYRLVLDDALILDPEAPLLYQDIIGREASLLRVEDCRRPSWVVEAAEATPPPEGSLRLAARFVPGVTGDGLDGPSVELSGVEGAALTVEGDVVTVRAEGLSPGRYSLRLRARDEAGRAAEELFAPIWVEAGERSWEDALIYQVVTDRFALSGPPLDEGLPREEKLTARHGGDLLGLLSVLESGYFERLGVNTLWLSPLYDNPDDLWPWYLGLRSSAYHGYWPIDSRAVEPLLGGGEAARALIEAAHARGLRVILDVVPNHVHIEHPYFVEHADEGWFNGGVGECVCGSSCSWAEDLDRCWFSEYLPDLRWRNPVVARQVVEDTLFWLDAYEVDGLRIDAIPMMPRLATRELVYAVRRRFERGPFRVHLLGETYASDHETIASGLGPFGLDGQFDFPVMWAIRRVIGEGLGEMSDLDEAIIASEEAWAEVGGGADGRALMSPFIGNHDLPRFLSLAAGDHLWDPVGSPPPAHDEPEPYRRLLLAQAVALTSPGAPVIYYGDELGLPGATDPDNRRPMRFDDELSANEADALERTARLGRLRACLPALRRGERATLLAGEDLYVSLRDLDDGAPAIVALNRSGGPLTVEVELPSGLHLPPSSALVDALSGAAVPFDGATLGPFELPGLSSAVIVTEGSGCSSP